MDQCNEHHRIGGSATPMQSRRMALLESMLNVVADYGLAVLFQFLAFPMLGIRLSLGARGEPRNRIFTAVSVTPPTMRRTGSRFLLLSSRSANFRS